MPPGLGDNAVFKKKKMNAGYINWNNTIVSIVNL